MRREPLKVWLDGRGRLPIRHSVISPLFTRGLAFSIRPFCSPRTIRQRYTLGNFATPREGLRRRRPALMPPKEGPKRPLPTQGHGLEA